MTEENSTFAAEAFNSSSGNEAVEGRILFIRGHRVMLDADLAEILSGNHETAQRAGQA